MATPNHFLAINSKATGEDIADPTRASKPTQETYKAPKFDRGSVVIERTGPDGVPLPQSKYGQNQNAVPSSVGVTQAAGPDGTGLSDFDISPTGGDPVLKKLALEGFGDHSGEDSAVADLSRKIDIAPFPPSFGMRSRSGESGTIPAKNGSVQAQPVRKPGA